MKINLDKLTPFDTQVVTTMGLRPDEFRLCKDAMDHTQLGLFMARFNGLVHSMQVIKQGGFSGTFRQLSWRGGIVVYREFCALLASAVPEPPRAEVESMKPAMAAGGGGAFGGSFLTTLQAQKNAAAAINAGMIPGALSKSAAQAAALQQSLATTPQYAKLAQQLNADLMSKYLSQNILGADYGVPPEPEGHDGRGPG